MTYTVSSDRLAGHTLGDTVTVDDLPPGTNIDALVAAGHLTVVTKPKSRKANTESEAT